MIDASNPVILPLMLILQGLWGVFLLTLTWAMKRVLKDIEANTQATAAVAKSVSDINVLISGNYITRTDYDRIDLRMREAEAKVIELRTIIALRSELTK